MNQQEELKIEFNEKILNLRKADFQNSKNVQIQVIKYFKDILKNKKDIKPIVVVTLCGISYDIVLKYIAKGINGAPVSKGSCYPTPICIYRGIYRNKKYKKAWRFARDLANKHNLELENLVPKKFRKKKIGTDELYLLEEAIETSVFFLGSYNIYYHLSNVLPKENNSYRWRNEYL